MASETITYTYDVHGRVIRVERVGAVNDDVQSDYSYDKADNREAVTIDDGATPLYPAFSIADPVPVTEGGTLVFTVTKTGSATASHSVSYATANGTATAGTDYTAKSGTLTFTTAQNSQTISVVTIDDRVVEPNETMLINLSSPTGGATLAAAQATGTINDKPNQPPTTVADSGGIDRCSTGGGFGVTFNDSDPEGDLPLTLIAVSAGTHGTATVASSTSVGYDPFGNIGTEQLTYTVRDSLGATSTGKLTISIVNGSCPLDP